MAQGASIPENGEPPTGVTAQFVVFAGITKDPRPALTLIHPTSLRLAEGGDVGALGQTSIELGWDDLGSLAARIAEARLHVEKGIS